MRYLYLIEYMTFEQGVGESDGAVVCARNEGEAKDMTRALNALGLTVAYPDPSSFTAKLLGPADDNVEMGVVCSSFNAG